jgi:acyl-CoA synthetase (AMP-forming)/AMP-acid ligase II
LTKRAYLSPNQEGLVCEQVRRTFRQLNEQANRLAHAMRALGVGQGDRVALLALNEPEYYDLFFGLGKIGAVLVPVNYRLAGPEMAYILNDCGAKVFVFGKEYLETVNSFRAEIPARHLIAIGDTTPAWAESYAALLAQQTEAEPKLAGGGDDTITVLYTSGTTGRPKGAMLTHANYFWTSTTMLATLGYTGDTFLVALPLFHIGALAGVPMFVHFGQRAVLLRSFDAKRFLELIPEEKVTGFGSVPQLLMFLKLIPGFDKSLFKTVKLILVYAAPVPVALIKEYAEVGIEVRQLYGLTECTGPATVIDSEHAITKAGSCGLPFFHTDLQVVRDDGSEAGPEELGEVLLRAGNVMKGYLNKPEATAETIVEGWLHTGDVAKKDAEGFLYIMDRKKDMIISGGENIYPAEIEDVIFKHPQVADVGVIGYPDPKWGEAVKAIVVKKPGVALTEAELIAWCKERIGKFKIPRQVIFADAIPRTPTGKILKRELRQKYN